VIAKQTGRSIEELEKMCKDGHEYGWRWMVWREFNQWMFTRIVHEYHEFVDDVLGEEKSE
jgi:hypothetical protein